MHQRINFISFWNDILHVSDGLSAHHQEFKTVHAATGFCLKNKNQLDSTYYFIAFLIGSTCFGHYYAHHQELATIMLITTLVVSYLVYCRLEVRCG